jgi:hypothetical protein
VERDIRTKLDAREDKRVHHNLGILALPAAHIGRAGKGSK